jgi:RimJ/RimL family protein N-acetyltransferase
MKLPFAPALPIQTPRLVLRAFRPDDQESLLGIHSDPVAVRYVPYPPRDRAALEPVLQRKVSSTELQRDGDLLELAVAVRDGGTLIGDLLFALRSAEHQTVEIGYIFSRAYAGQGYATESVRALLDLAFGPAQARRVIARVDDRNIRSLALLDRLGLRREAHLIENEWFKGELSSEVDYAILAPEWLTRS